MQSFFASYCLYTSFFPSTFTFVFLTFLILTENSPSWFWFIFFRVLFFFFFFYLPSLFVSFLHFSRYLSSVFFCSASCLPRRFFLLLVPGVFNGWYEKNKTQKNLHFRAQRTNKFFYKCCSFLWKENTQPL